jgi:hypothetical protein
MRKCVLTVRHSDCPAGYVARLVRLALSTVSGPGCFDPGPQTRLRRLALEGMLMMSSPRQVGIAGREVVQDVTAEVSEPCANGLNLGSKWLGS